MGMSSADFVKKVGSFLIEGPPRFHRYGEQITLIKDHTITLKHLDPPRMYRATSTVGFVLTNDPEQLDRIEALELVEPELLTTGPKPGEVWNRKIAGSSDEQYSFACVASDDDWNSWLVWHRTFDGEAFVISKEDFFEDRENWEIKS